MSDMTVENTERAAAFQELLPQVGALIEGESDLIANLANIAALIHSTFGFHWVGFYLVKNDQLVLGPFQGPVACTRIAKGRGVCGSAWADGRTVVVEDVEEFPGHIACSPLSRSEIVVPMLNESGTVVGVLDIDSSELAEFDSTDKHYLERMMELLMKTVK